MCTCTRLLTVVVGNEILLSQDYSLSITKVIKNWNLYSYQCEWGGADPKGPAGSFKAQLWASRPAPSPHGDAVDICVFTKIWYFFVFWFSYNSVQLFDEQFLPNCELVDSRHPAPPPQGMLTPPMHRGKKVLRFLRKIH